MIFTHQKEEEETVRRRRGKGKSEVMRGGGRRSRRRRVLPYFSLQLLAGSGFPCTKLRLSGGTQGAEISQLSSGVCCSLVPSLLAAPLTHPQVTQQEKKKKKKNRTRGFFSLLL